MREFDEQHAADGDDGGADVPSQHAQDGQGDREARHEAVRDAATRKAYALEYRQRVEAAYADYEAGHAIPQDVQPKPERAAHSDDERPQRVPSGPDTLQRPAPAEELGDSWSPSDDDRDRVGKLYSEYLAEVASTDGRGRRDQGTNSVGPKPDLSPGDISGLPPSGDELAEMESSKGSRLDGLLRDVEKEENFSDLNDVLDENASTVQQLLSARPPEGHAEQSVPTHPPHIVSGAPEHGIDGGSAASAVLVAGILTIHLAHWIDDKLNHRKGDHDASHG